jgi:hypothetical protein
MGEVNRWHLLETERAELCRTTAPHMSVTELVAYYSIDRKVAEELWGHDAQPTVKARKQKPADALITYARTNLFAHITSKQVCEMCECSLPTALRLLDARPDVFRKIKRGVWEVRDPKADREADKNQSNKGE